MTDQTADIQFGRPFILVRDGKVIADGTQFPDGHVAIHWTGCKTPTLTPHQTFDDALAAHRDGGAVRAVWQPTAIPQARYADVWPELTGWVQAAQEDGDQIDPAQLLEYMRELKQRALAPVRQWVDETRGAVRRATQADTSTFRCGLCNAPWHDAHGQPGDPCKPAARQATGQADTEPRTHGMDPAAILGIHADTEQSDPTTADDPTPLRWGLGDVLHSDDDSIIVCLSGPDREPYALHLEPEQRDALREDLTPPTVGPYAGGSYLTAEHETLGMIAARFGGDRMAWDMANPWVSDTAMPLPAGLRVAIPVTDEPDPVPVVGQPAAAPDTDARTARDDLYEALDQSWYRWDPQSMAKGTGIIRLIDAHAAEVRAAVLREAMNDLCAFGHGEAASFLLRKVEAAGEAR